jgi:manganese/iron transport system permease protein/iron/zinc/copper transport system permease protein
MLVASSVIGAGCGFVGMNLSYHLDVPSGTMIVLTGAAVFGLTLVFAGPRRRRLARRAVRSAAPATL